MKKAIIITILSNLTFVFILSVANVDAIDPEAALQVSKGIAKWKLLTEDKSDTQVEPPVYVSSSLSGLAAFNIESQIRQRELNTGVKFSKEYISRLLKNPTVGVGGTITTTAIGINAHPAYSIISTMGSAVTTGMEIIDRIGTSMQVRNPPIYLNEKTSWGWKGHDSYSIPGGIVSYYETLDTSASRWWEPGNITRTHTDLVTTNLGTYYRNVEIKTPATSFLERFMVHQYPTGSHVDSLKSTRTTTTEIRQRYTLIQESYTFKKGWNDWKDTNFNKKWRWNQRY